MSFPVLMSNYISKRSKQVGEFNYRCNYPLIQEHWFDGKMHEFLRMCNLTSPQVPAVVYGSLEQSSYRRQPRYIMLKSYTTNIEVYDTDRRCFCRLWDSFSSTTCRHEWKFKDWLAKNVSAFAYMQLDGTQQLEVPKEAMYHWGDGWYGREIGKFPEFTELYWYKTHGRAPIVWEVVARELVDGSVIDWSGIYSVVKRKGEPWQLYNYAFKALNDYVVTPMDSASTFEEIKKILEDEINYKKTVRLLEKTNVRRAV